MTIGNLAELPMSINNLLLRMRKSIFRVGERKKRWLGFRAFLQSCQTKGLWLTKCNLTSGKHGALTDSFSYTLYFLNFFLLLNTWKRRRIQKLWHLIWMKKKLTLQALINKVDPKCSLCSRSPALTLPMSDLKLPRSLGTSGSSPLNKEHLSMMSPISTKGSADATKTICEWETDNWSNLNKYLPNHVLPRSWFHLAGAFSRRSSQRWPYQILGGQF